MGWDKMDPYKWLRCSLRLKTPLSASTIMSSSHMENNILYMQCRWGIRIGIHLICECIKSESTVFFCEKHSFNQESWATNKLILFCHQGVFCTTQAGDYL